MIRRHRGILALVMVLATTALSAVLAWQAWAWYLPDAQHAEGPALLRWIVIRDLGDVDRDTQILLVDRFVRQFETGFPPSTSSISLSASQQSRLQGNIGILKQIWFETRVQQYAQCEPDQRLAYLQRQLATIWTFADLDIEPIKGKELAAEDDACDPSSHGLLADLDSWVASASGMQAVLTERAVRDGLICWLATRSLEEQPSEVRQHLAERIAAELDDGLKPEGIELPLDVSHREMLATNAQWLLEAWLHGQAEIYAETPLTDRPAYLDSQLDRLARWQLDRWLATGESAPDSSMGSGMIGLLTTAQAWVERAPPERQADLAKLAWDVQQRVVWRGLQRLVAPSIR